MAVVLQGRLGRALWVSTLRLPGPHYCCRHMSSSSPLIQVMVTKEVIRTIKINRPEKYNACTDDMYRSLALEVNNADADEKTKLIVLTGAGDRFFTSGYDLKTLTQYATNPIPSMDLGAPRFMEALVENRTPIVALLNGSAVGVGVTCLALCDAVIASDKAKFNTPFIKLGLPPECCSSYLFPMMMGYPKASALLLFNETWTSNEAKEAGLVTHIFPHDKVQEEGWKLIEDWASNDKSALMRGRALIRDAQRETLRKVHREEFQFDTKAVGNAALKILSSKKK